MSFLSATIGPSPGLAEGPELTLSGGSGAGLEKTTKSRFYLGYSARFAAPFEGPDRLGWRD